MNLEFKEITNKDEWNNFVTSQVRYSFVQSWEYTNVISALTSEVHRIGVYKDSNLIALLPIGIIKAKRGNYLRLRHGPVLNEEGRKQENFREIVGYLKQYAKERKLNFIRIHPFVVDDAFLKKNKFMKAPTHNLDAEVTLQLELKGKTAEELQANMRKNTRYYIRKSGKEGVEVIRENDDFENFYRIFKSTSERQNYTTWPRAYYEKLFSEFDENQRNLYFATVKGEKVAIGFFVDFGKYRYYLEGGMSMEYTDFYPAYAIQWKAISDALEKGIETYDFWGGVSPKNHSGDKLKNYPWTGINIFKAGFGGDEISMVHLHDLPINWKYCLTYLFETLERKKRGY